MNNPNAKIKNEFAMRGNSQIWHYVEGCEYQSDFHFSCTEWHHPISTDEKCGLWLCQGHHSIVQGRNIPYNEETKPLKEQRNEIMELVYAAVRKAGHDISEIDKN